MITTLRRQHLAGAYLTAAAAFACGLVLLAAPASAQGQSGGHGSPGERSTNSETSSRGVPSTQAWSGRASAPQAQPCFSDTNSPIYNPYALSTGEDMASGWGYTQTQPTANGPGLMSLFGYNNPSLLSWWGTNPYATPGASINGCGNFQGFFP